ncbi:MAG: M24 family metallopeptidase [Phycisphaera sp.]|nr:M24 family metallopeptidase [Phycisphaera sp.]
MTKSKTPPVLAERLKDLRKRIHKAHADALLIINPRDIRYLTGFVGDDSWMLVPARGSNVTVISDSRFEEQIEHEAPHVRAVIRKKGQIEALHAELKRSSIKKLAVQERLSMTLHRAMTRLLGKHRVKPIDDKIILQRAVKTPDEVRNIEHSLKIQQEAFRKLLKWVKPGQTESEVAAYLEYTMRVLGADGVSFPAIVAADANASIPHAIPGPRKLKKNGILLVDWGSKYKGYCSDMTRVIAFGKMPVKIKEIYKIVLEAQVAAIEKIAPGVRLRDVDAAARDIIKKAGYGDRFGHGLGHGLGLDIHEQPSFGQRSKGELEPGHVVTVEPGIYLPGVGGVRLEDDVLVTAKGKRVLSDLPKSLEWAII